MKPFRTERIKNLTETVDFEKTNRLPEITGLKECRKTFANDRLCVWYEYIPETIKTGKMPLVIQLHGGGNDGKRWADYTIWHKLADKEGCMIVYPNSPTYGCWMCTDDDIEYLYELILYLKEKYEIDPSRIYMQGMSNGDMMTLAFSMKHPEMLAAAAFITGPTAEEILDGDRPEGALPILQMRGEMDVNWRLDPQTADVYEKRYHMNDINREIWEPVNGTEGVIPLLSVKGKDNYLVYRGTSAPIINWEVKTMGHREPAAGAQTVWNYLYRNCSLTQKGHEVSEELFKDACDEDMTVASAGSSFVYKNGKILQISDLEHATVRIILPAETGHFCPVKLGEMAETEVMCVPVQFFEKVYGAELQMSASGDACRMIFPNGTDVSLSADSLLMEVNNEYMALQKPCIFRCGVFYVPAAEFCRLILNKQVSEADDVICITDHYSELGRYTARVMRKILGGEMRPRQRDN